MLFFFKEVAMISADKEKRLVEYNTGTCISLVGFSRVEDPFHNS